MLAGDKMRRDKRPGDAAVVNGIIVETTAATVRAMLTKRHGAISRRLGNTQRPATESVTE